MSNLNDVTILIKTFIRPDSCQKLLDSIRKFYPTVPVIIVNDGDDGKVWEDEYTKTITMPFDSGASAGRNEGVKHIETKYMVLCDDDFLFTEDTDLQLWKDLLIESGLDMVGGSLSNHRDFHWCLFKSKDNMWSREHKVPHKTLDNGVLVVDYCLQFFCARTDSIAQHPWDNSLKTHEHSAWFWAHRDSWSVGWTDRVSARHEQSRSRRYNSYRNRVVKK